jgi:pimeloyl-ACP methyl ester carboxylesterase
MFPSALLYAVILYFAAMIGWILWHLLSDTAPRMLAHDQNKLRGTGLTFSETQEKDHYTVSQTIEDGIERIAYTPKERKHETPILMAHGMWHGAWCWQPWQEFLAERGWESVAYSLPGHGKSPLQRSLTNCTLGYYLSFVRDEIARLPRKPVLMGHSMGGALSQWVLRYVETDLPAVVLVAPWVSHSSMADWPALSKIMADDPIGMALMFVTWNANSWVRTPQVAASKLLSKEAVVSPEELQRQLVGESSLVIFQHNPPFWKPAENVKTPILLLAGERDAVLSVESLRKTAVHYQANFDVILGAGHNLMMERSYLKTVNAIDVWLNLKQIA